MTAVLVAVVFAAGVIAGASVVLAVTDAARRAGAPRVQR